MKYLDHSFALPEHNLAFDEWLLDQCEAGLGDEVLRVWEPRSPFVVLGFSNPVATETHEAACRKDRLPLLRRSSGGGTVVQAPGCLNFSLVLKIASNRELRNISCTNCYVLKQNGAAVAKLVSGKVETKGISDLALAQKKFSGNAQRRKRVALLFHGTFLLKMDLKLISKYLKMPSREPDYREGRSHEEFVTNLNVKAADLKRELRSVWKATAESPKLSPDLTPLLKSKFSNPAWNRKY